MDKDALEILSKFRTVITLTVVIAGYMVNIKSHHDGPLVFWLADSLHARSPLLQRARPTLLYTTLPPTYNITRHVHLSCTLNDHGLLLGRLCPLLLLLSSPTERGTERLRPDAQPTGLLDDRLVYRQSRAVYLYDILHKICQSGKGRYERESGINAFSRSILASAAIRVSRMRLTIHFSPSSGVRLRRAERSLLGI